MKIDSSKQTFKLVLIAIFIALSIIIGSFEVNYIPAPWLKIDFSEVVILIAINIIGADLALIIIVLRSFIRYFITGGTNIPFPFYGELIAVMFSYCLIFLYSVIKDYLLKNKVKYAEIYTGICVIVLISIFGFLVNFLLNVPAFSSAGKYFFLSDDFLIEYFNFSLRAYFISIISIYLPFNLLKYLLVFIAFNSIYYSLKHVDFFKGLLLENHHHHNMN